MRSAAETEIRDAVVARLRAIRPGARICHEVNVTTFVHQNRMDLLAVDVGEIIAVEIKSERDEMKRATAQIPAMKSVSHHALIALHECHLVEHETNEWAAHYGKLDGKHYQRRPPPEAKGADAVWVFPECQRCPNGDSEVGLWRAPERRLEATLPSAAVDLLWRDELAELCGVLRVSAHRRSTMREMASALRWHCTGKELTLGVCSVLRRRKFAEADPPIDGKAAAPTRFDSTEHAMI